MGLNTFIPLPVPPGNNAVGVVVDVSGLRAKKSVYLSGAFDGVYEIEGSHDNAHFVPVLQFSGGGGPHTIRRDVAATLRSMRVRRNARQSVSISVAGQAVCPC